MFPSERVQAAVMSFIACLPAHPVRVIAKRNRITRFIDASLNGERLDRVTVNRLVREYTYPAEPNILKKIENKNPVLRFPQTGGGIVFRGSYG
jgi:hypothetical protein